MSYRTEKTNQGIEIVIDGFEKGIAESPYKGIGDMRNVDPLTIPEEASVAMAPTAMLTQGKITDVTFTVDPATEIFTYDGVIPLEVNTVIFVTNSGGALPTGMSANTPYYIKTVPSATTFTVSAVSAGGATLDVTGAGSGTNTFSTLQMGTPKFYTSALIESRYSYFMLDSNGRAWIYGNQNYGSTAKWTYMYNLADETFPGNGNGLIAWKGWLFVWESNSLRVIPLLENNLSSLAFLTTKANWSAWKTATDILNLTSTLASHYAIIGQDDTIYFCNGHGVGSILEIAGQTFAPNTGRTVTDGETVNGDATITSANINFTNLDIGAEITGDGIPAGTTIIRINSESSAEMSTDATSTNSGATFAIEQSATFNSLAVDIPSTDEAICLAELGTNLLIGGMNNFIYPWDRVSPSYAFPIFLSESYVSRMVTVNTVTFIFVGRRGRIYVTNGSNANLYWKMPDYLSGTVNPTFIWTDATFTRNLIFFGVQCKKNDGTVVNEYGGLWALTPEGGAGWLINQMSYGTYSGYVSALYSYRGDNKSAVTTNGVFGNSTGYGLFVGWYDGTNGGHDKGTSLPYTGGQAYVTSDMIPVGTFLDKKTFEQLEFKLTSPLVTGESVTLYYRPNLTDAFVQVPILQGGGVGELSGVATVNFENVEWVQIRAFLTGTGTTPSFNRLRQLRIK